MKMTEKGFLLSCRRQRHLELRLLWIWLVFPIPRFHTMTGLYMCYPISWTIALVPNAILLFNQLRRLPVGDIGKERPA